MTACKQMTIIKEKLLLVAKWLFALDRNTYKNTVGVCAGVPSMVQKISVAKQILFNETMCKETTQKI